MPHPPPLDQHEHPGDGAGATLAGRRDTLRVITFNVLGCRGFPRQSGGPVVFAEPAPELCAALADRLRAWRADLVLLQEAPPAESVGEIAHRAGMNAAFFPPQQVPGGVWPFGFPGAILSHLPITGVEDLAAGLRRPGDPRFHRHWGAATLLAGAHRPRVGTAHLCADWPGHDGEPTRLAEVEAFLRAPPADLLGADCNTRPDTAPWRRLREAGWRDAWQETGEPGEGFTSDTRYPIQRFDYLWLGPASPWRAVRAAVLRDLEVRIGGEWILLSDHFPLAVDLVFDAARSIP